MTTLNLDTQCALARGWKFHRSVQDRGLWEESWILPDGSQIACSQYRPSTDRNQAVDFAQDAIQLPWRVHITLIGHDHRVTLENVASSDPDKAFKSGYPRLAEDICHATLATLRKEK